MKKCELGRILSHNYDGFSFKIVFPELKDAMHYKEMMGFILKSDKYIVDVVKGLYEGKDSDENYHDERIRV
jgi:hypothetical protein